jgi:O-succinylbenzoate synthase
MSRQIAVKSYQRPFRHPLRTARSEWSTREGFLLRVEGDGQIGYGEVAPLPEFGSETVEQARAFLQQLIRQPDLEVPASLSCCAFGLSAASAAVSAPPGDYSISALLPAGVAALRLVSDKVDLGYRNFKWKIGVEPIAKEITMARSLIESLPAEVRVRFDANASLTPAALEQWLALLVTYPEQVEYMEQPLACGQEEAMAAYMASSGIAIALDESLNAPDGKRWLEPGAWAGALVVKAPLMGEVSALTAKLAPVAEQVVLSSVFETGIGLENCLRLADALPALRRPIGFDTLDAFDDPLQPLESAPQIRAVDRQSYTAEQIWNLI